MIPERYHVPMFLLAFTAALIAILVTSFQMLDARAAAQDSADNLAQCQSLSKQITSLREYSVVASQTDQAHGVRNSEITQIGEREGIRESQIAGIDRLPAESIPDTEYKREDMVLRLTGVSMEQLVRCLIAIRDRDGELLPTAVVLRPDRSRVSPSAERETWSADVTLTRLVYVATNPGSQ